MRLRLRHTGIHLGAALRLAVAPSLIALLAASPAPAQTIDEEPVGRLTIGGVLGVGFPSLSDVDENFDVVNRFLARDELRKLDDVKAGLLTGVDVRYKLSDRYSAGVTWGAMNARSEFVVSRAEVRFFTRATTYEGTLYYHIPRVEELNERLQATAGLGLLVVRNGLVEWTLVDNTTNFFIRDGDISELSGTGKGHADGLGFSLRGGASYQLSPRFSVALDFGYRFANLGELELNDDEFVGYRERFGTEEGTGDELTREPGDWGVYDFFLRDPNGRTPDGRLRTDPQVPGEDKTGCAGCPLYYEGGPIEVDYSGPFSSVSIRLHF